MTKTTNYQLNQWTKSDRVMMEDFNADNQKIDAALAAKSRVACGVYTGDGTVSRTIDLDFTPKAVLVSCDNAASYATASNNITYYGGIATQGQPLYACNKARDTIHIPADCLPAIEVGETGFTVHQSYTEINTVGYYASTNQSGYRYRYFAIG